MTSVSCVLLALALLAGCASTITPTPPAAQVPRPGAQVPPLAWEDWTPAAFARAKAERKLILVNVAAGWCHWCHVMDAQTFRDAEVVDLIASRFVAIRVDADARPDVAERYQRWGWPATAVLTPDARPVTERRGYQPPREYAALLRDLSDAHAAGRDVARAAAPPAAPVSDLASVTSALRAQLDSYYDEAQHGWGTGQKYPLPAAIEHAFLRGDPAWRARALATLAAQTALIDPVWGGMFQYSDDGTWGGGRHWEKIVPIQTGAIESYVLAYRVTGDDAWLEPARAIHRYLVEHLRSPDGAFWASQDADPPGGTGAAFYALDDAARRETAQPRIDTNVYADLNGMIITALCHLYEVTGEREVLDQAIAAAESILRTHRVGAALKHAPDSPDAPLFLADQVAFADACLALVAVAPDRQRWLYLSTDLAKVIRRFEAKDGGFLATPRDAETTIADQRRPWKDNALAVRFVLRYEAAWSGMLKAGPKVDRALRVVLADREQVKGWGRLVGEMLLALEESALPDLAVVVAGPEDPMIGMLLAAARRTYAPRFSVHRDVSGGRDYPTDRPAAFICGGGTCFAEITDPAALPDAIRRFATGPR